MIRAYIREDFLGMSIAVTLIREGDGGLNPPMILRLPEGENRFARWENLPEQPGADVAPTFKLGEDEARVLLDALTRHFDGAEDTRALRRDYDAERKRVDTLTSALVDVTRQLAEPPREAVTYSASFPGGLSEEAVTDAFKHAKRDGRW